MYEASTAPSAEGSEYWPDAEDHRKEPWRGRLARMMAFGRALAEHWVTAIIVASAFLSPPVVSAQAEGGGADWWTSGRLGDVRVSSVKSHILRVLSHDLDSHLNSLFFEKADVLMNSGGLRSGRHDLVVYVRASQFCGTGGCNALLLEDISGGGAKRRNAGSTLLDDVGPARLPIVSLKTKHRGWHDLGIFVAGGGITNDYIAQLVLDGRRYRDNPTVPQMNRLAPGQVHQILIDVQNPSSLQCRLR